MDETFITLSINKFLNENNYEVIQCIPPGGQGGIYYSLKNNIIYPDIICLKDKILYIGENKTLFNESDERKLFELSKESNLFKESQKIIDNFLKSKNKPNEKIDYIKFFLGFSYESKKKSNIHINFVVGKDGKVILKN
tara:strand:- start:355 stop:768 length:414 start_codon:yes stop_codon:yes gene_type:complete